MSAESPEELLERIGIDPILTAYAAKGYHGTSDEKALEIVRDGFDPCLAQMSLYGRGFYFYEDDAPHPGQTAAVYFVKKWKKSYSPIAVIKADVSVGGNLLFDLVSIPANRMFFENVQKAIVKRAVAAGEVAQLDDRTIGTVTVEFIMQHSSKVRVAEAIRALFRMPDLDPPHQHGVCARHKKCIANPEKVTLR